MNKYSLSGYYLILITSHSTVRVQIDVLTDRVKLATLGTPHYY